MIKVFCSFFLIAIFSQAKSQLNGIDSSYFTVRLSSFDINLQANNLTKLHWKTICFLQYANFELQKSYDGVNFSTFHSFSADRLRCQQPFDFIDSSIHPNENIYYRINAGNAEGKFYSSAIKYLALKDKNFKVYPLTQNIVSSTVSFSVANFDVKPIKVFIFNSTGVLFKTVQLQLSKGISSVNISVDNLQTGLFYLKIQKDVSEPIVLTFIKQ